MLEQKIHEKKLEEENRALIERLKMERDEFQKRLEEVTISKERKLECLEKKLIDKEQELKEERERMESLRHQETEDSKTAREKVCHSFLVNSLRNIFTYMHYYTIRIKSFLFYLLFQGT